MSELDKNTYWGNISKKARLFNKLDPEQIKDGIDAARGINNLKSRETIEYVVGIEDDELEM